MDDEPQGELARYAFGYSDKKPGWFWWLVHLGMVAFILWSLFSGSAKAAGCRKHSIWHYPWPQRCYTAYAPPPSIQRRADEQSHDWSVEITKFPDAWKLDPEPESTHIEVTPPAPPDNDRAHGLDKLKEMLK